METINGVDEIDGIHLIWILNALSILSLKMFDNIAVSFDFFPSILILDS
jgi:hypothetical protein